MNSIAKLMSDCNYLPPFLRDFHNQKDLFKRIDEIVCNAQRKAEQEEYSVHKKMPDWIACHIYVVDYFLWYMAKCGYTLQKNRSKIQFVDYDKDMAAFMTRRRGAILSDMKSPQE